MAFPTLTNEKPAAATIRDGLGFVLTTTPRPRRKDSDREHLHQHTAGVHR